MSANFLWLPDDVGVCAFAGIAMNYHMGVSEKPTIQPARTTQEAIDAICARVRARTTPN